MAKVIQPLTDKQKYLIDENWKTKHFDELVKMVYENDELDGRNAEGRAIKNYLQEKYGHVAGEILKTKTLIPRKEPYILTPDDKRFILENNAKFSKPLELCSALFKVPITNFDRRYKAVITFLKESFVEVDDSIVPTETRYNVPRSLDRLLPKINQYMDTDYSMKNLTPDIERKTNSLLRYMQVYRFDYIINQYTKEYQRRIFEESFIRYTFDKIDLTQEEVDLYINLCDEIVNSTNIKYTVAQIESKMSNAYESDDEEAQKLSMTFIELLNSMREKQDKSQQRVKQLIDSLNGSRSKRLAQRQASTATILNLVDAWKDKEKRDKIIELAQREKMIENNEVEALETLDELKAFIVGLSKEEAKHG